eukprot:gnl/TRDRNA2_/TRDRNA2_81639_c0_seq1.p1 gnl/TRDRNA2_/TRDRNA2_81639_c0~~gnl/TRDRNA2_/TRDRNA2_81639_c0_seq1.p1  ORF type:complete len:351 (-),score=28.56 gnl/TRDRNA2_/TRDRNA2_81639_c0_seq1:58-1110(-)
MKLAGCIPFFIHFVALTQLACEGVRYLGRNDTMMATDQFSSWSDRSNACHPRPPNMLPKESTPPDGEKGYRLGDMFDQPWRRTAQGSGFDFHIRNYPASLAAMYMRATDAQSDYEVLWDCVQSKLKSQPNKVSIPNVTDDEASRTAVIHLRVGDVLDDEHGRNFTVDEYLEQWHAWHEGTWNLYFVVPAKYFREEEYLNLTGIEKVIIIANPYHGLPSLQRPSRSLEYIAKVGKIIKARGVAVEQRVRTANLGGGPQREAEEADKDVLFFLSKNWGNVLLTAGGFSGILQGLLNKAGSRSVRIHRDAWDGPVTITRGPSGDSTSEYLERPFWLSSVWHSLCSLLIQVGND